MIKKRPIIRSSAGYYYVYIYQSQSFHLLPDECVPYWTGEKKFDETFASRKVQYLMDLEDSDKREKEEFIIKYSPEKLERNLANLNNLLIEVTDKCNLSCKYCGYGELYSDYDSRLNKNNTFENVKVLIDYLCHQWNSIRNFSFNKTCHIGFYGGEPLMNISLIKDTINYLNSLYFSNGLHFEYHMTTNAMLLEKYMDYITEQKIHLLISLDGNQFNDSYRVRKNGLESFKHVIRNIHALQNKYPDYFNKYVNFNAVLHNRNSVRDIVHFIKEEFDKIPTIAALSTNGIRTDKQEEFWKMFHNPMESYKDADKCDDIKDLLEKSPDISIANYFIHSYCGLTFKKYSDLFVTEKDKQYIPTGTCSPLKKKLFLTVNGKLLACERIGQNHALGEVTNGKVNIDFEQISSYYERLFNKIIHLCKFCTIRKGCGICIYHQRTLEEKQINCDGFTPASKQIPFFCKHLSYFEKKRETFGKVINEMIII